MKIIFLFFLIVTSFSFGQSTNQVYEYLFVDEIPKFDNNDMNFLDYYVKYFSPPDIGAEDIITASFIVDEEGKVTDVKIINSHVELYKNYIYEYLSTMPKWKPGKLDGKNVKVRLYITFKLFFEG